ncbi:hypothetical protein KIN20_005658 [Parelaphostrongylus tenuis]|uniref:C2HC/C3H-type domain-containing protein n=1 Tax=Parelaphostrongylus tenuis TaxID=148309 RepID=A0AAD5M3L1_PARTN|nr:hypothetical protein KIN20_005658 [Parelaphostrongylus tenuis]
MAEEESGGSVEPTFPCKICSRKFIETSLVKHEPVCKKLSKLNRKPFDSGKQRANGSDITYADVRRAAKEREKLGGVFPRPMTNWKERHETFIDAVSSSKKVDYAIKTGAPLPPPPRTAVPSGKFDDSCTAKQESLAERTTVTRGRGESESRKTHIEGAQTRRK